MGRQEVWILAISHRHGTDLRAFSDSDKAVKFLYGYVKDNWDDVSTKEIPEDEDEAIEVYFDRTSSLFIEPEYFLLEPSTIDP